MNKGFTVGIAIVVSTFIAANAILLFSEKSQLARSYYIEEYDRAQANTYAQEIEKESLIVPAKETVVTIEAEAVSDFKIAEGDIVQQGAELAQLKTESADNQRSLWEAEQQAYMQEQSQLQQIISSLESERAGSDATSYGEGSTTGTTTDDVIDVAAAAALTSPAASSSRARSSSRLVNQACSWSRRASAHGSKRSSGSRSPPYSSTAPCRSPASAAASKASTSIQRCGASRHSTSSRSRRCSSDASA